MTGSSEKASNDTPPAEKEVVEPTISPDSDRTFSVPKNSLHANPDSGTISIGALHKKQSDPGTMDYSSLGLRKPERFDEVGRLGGFRILRMLGEGGMGAVFLAEDELAGRCVALKVMRPEIAMRPTSRDRFKREAQAAAALSHDNIVPIWQVGEDNGCPFIAMPFLCGESLDARIKRTGSSSIGLTLKMAREVADGLSAAHAKALIHRDIKPGNIWVEGDPAAKELADQVKRHKILDFGLARSTEQTDDALTNTGTILGTPAYMAPEQAAGERVDARADLWSLGVMMYRMTAGRLPFTASANSMAILTSLAVGSSAAGRDD